MNSEQKWQEARTLLNGGATGEQLDKAIRNLEEAAACNHGGAFCTLAQVYSTGIGVEQNKDKAYEMACKSMELGYRRAKLILADLLLEGEPSEENIRMAYAHLCDLAESRNPEACAALGNYIHRGLIPAEEEEGLMWLQKGTEMGDMTCMARLAWAYLERCRDEEACYWLEQVKMNCDELPEGWEEKFSPDTYAERRSIYIGHLIENKSYDKVINLLEGDIARGDIDAQLILADIHLEGMGEEKYAFDPQAGLTILNGLSASGINAADYRLAQYYDNDPEGTDSQKAKEFLLRAANAGYPDAQWAVGTAYHDGVWGERDMEEAKRWIELAAGQDQKNALHLLACSYLQDPEIETFFGYNLDCENEPGQGLSYLVRSAELGNPDSLYVLALCYHKGKYVTKDDRQAFNCLEESLKQELKVDSVCLMGDFYMEGTGTDQDYEAAARHYKWAAERGSIKACRNLALMYENGWYFEKDGQMAASLYERANEFFRQEFYNIIPMEEARERAKQGDTEAMYQLGVRYQHGDGVEEDLEIASDWWLKAALKGHLASCHNLGCYYFSKHDVENALKWLEKSASAGDNNSNCFLGELYLNGNGVDADLEKAIGYLSLAAENNHGNSLKILAGVYHDGDFMVPDLDKARYYFEKYLALDSPEAHFFMARNLYSGDMYDQDYEGALEQLRIAVKGGCHEAYSPYLEMRWSGENCEIDREEVVSVFTKLAESYDDEAMVVMYSILSNEGNADRDYDKAMEYLMLAANRNYGHALYLLAQEYDNGGYLDIDLDKARECYEHALEQGYADAAVSLGVIYQEGKGVDADVKKALDYYLMAAESGNASAAFEAARLFATGGDGTFEEDCEKAVELLKNYADRDSHCCLLLSKVISKMLDKPDGYSWELATEAFDWMMKAKEMGNPDALYNLAVMYVEGTGTVIDIQQAKELFEYCVEHEIDVEDCQRYLKAMENESDLFSQRLYYWDRIAFNNPFKLEEPHPADAMKDHEYFKISVNAALCGETNAMQAVGFALLEDEPERAKEFFIKAIGQGRVDLARKLGEMYLYGYGVECDISMATDYYSAGAELDDSECLRFVALIMLTKENSEMDESASVVLRHLYSISEDESHDERFALYHLGMLTDRKIQAGKSLDELEEAEYRMLLPYYNVNGRFKDAADLYLNLAERLDRPELLKLLPEIYALAGEFEQAHDILDYCERTFPDDEILNVCRGVVHTIGADDEAALNDFNADVLIEKGDKTSCEVYAQLLYRNGRYQDSIDFVTRLEAASKATAVLLLSRARAYIQLKNTDAAISELEKIAIMPVCDENGLDPAFAYLLLGCKDECLKLIESGLEELESNYTYSMCVAYMDAAYLYCLAGDREKAFSMFNRAVESGFVMFDYMKAEKPELAQLPEVAYYLNKNC